MYTHYTHVYITMYVLIHHMNVHIHIICVEPQKHPEPPLDFCSRWWAWSERTRRGQALRYPMEVPRWGFDPPECWCLELNATLLSTFTYNELESPVN